MPDSSINMECGDSAPLSDGQPRLPAALRPPGEPPSRLVQSGAEAPHSKAPPPEASATHRPWHHAPLHVLVERDLYMVTAGTFRKEPFFRSADRLELLHGRLHACAQEFGWQLHAWAVLSNHYHFVAQSPEDPSTLRRFLNKLHMTTSKAVNQLDATPGRKVWFEYWDTRLTYERSYLARLHYVNHNPVHHRIVTEATAYPWCSAAQFETHADLSFQRTVAAMPIDQLQVRDDF
jgi:putative transposase